jgi:uncharacterized LabA/DUF88 family protein
LSKIAVFVDVQNIYYTVRQAYRCHFNYTAFWTKLLARGEIVTAYAYAVDRRDQKQVQFQQILKDIGFEVKLKPFIQRSDGSAKGDWDVGITLDVLEHADAVDTVVLASGDGDFDLLLDKVRQDSRVQAVVYGVPSLTAASLVRAASEFCPIEGDLLLSVQ